MSEIFEEKFLALLPFIASLFGKDFIHFFVQRELNLINAILEKVILFI